MSGLPPDQRIAVGRFCANGNDDAFDFIEAIGRCGRRIDDIADDDSSDPIADLAAAVIDLLMISANPFYQANVSSLLPVLVASIQNWEASETWRHSPHEQTRALAFIQRDAILSVAHCVAFLTGGPKHAQAMLHKMQEGYHGAGTETFTEWQEEVI